MPPAILQRPLGELCTRPAVVRASLLAFSAVLFLGELGDARLSANDTALHAGIARRMVQTGQWATPQLYGAPWYEHLPPFLWVTAASFELFGFTPFAARLPHVLLALVAIAAVFELGRLRAGLMGGLIAGLSLATTEMFWRYAARVRPDVPMVAFIALAMLCLDHAREGRSRWLLGWGLASGLAVFTKGPMAVVCFVAPVAALLADWRAGRRPWWKSGWLLAGLAAVAALPGPWIIGQFASGGDAWFRRYVLHQILWLPLHDQSAQKDYLVVPRVLLRIYWPWVALLVLALVQVVRRRAQALRPLAAVLAWALFIPAVLTVSRRQTEYYLLPAFPAFAVLIGWALADRLQSETAQARATLGVMGLAAALALVLAVSPLSPRRGSLELETERVEAMAPDLQRALAGGAELGIYGLHKDRTIWPLNLYLDLSYEPAYLEGEAEAAAGLRRGLTLLVPEGALPALEQAMQARLQITAAHPPLLLVRTSSAATPP